MIPILKKRNKTRTQIKAVLKKRGPAAAEKRGVKPKQISEVETNHSIATSPLVKTNFFLSFLHSTPSTVSRKKEECEEGVSFRTSNNKRRILIGSLWPFFTPLHHTYVRTQQQHSRRVKLLLLLLHCNTRSSSSSSIGKLKNVKALLSIDN